MCRVGGGLRGTAGILNKGVIGKSDGAEWADHWLVTSWGAGGFVNSRMGQYEMGGREVINWTENNLDCLTEHGSTARPIGHPVVAVSSAIQKVVQQQKHSCVYDIGSLKGVTPNWLQVR